MSIRNPFGGHSYAYAYGRSGVLQMLLLSQSDMDRLLGAHDRHDVERMLTELKLTSKIDQSLQQASTILPALAQWVRREVQQMSPSAANPVFSILWLHEDGALLSYLLKEEAGFTSAVARTPDPALSAYSPEALRFLVLEDRPGNLPVRLVEFVREQKRKEDRSPASIDSDVSKFIAETQMRLAKTSGSKHVREYVRDHIDLENIRIALRHADVDIRRAALLPGGSLPFDALLGDKQTLLRAIDRSNLSYELAESIEQIGEDPIAFERTAAEIIAHDIADMWNVPMSLEPLFAFAAIALSHITIIQTVLVGKSNSLSPQEIKRILPPFIPATHYVL